MSNPLVPTNNQYTFWKRPEGTTGKAILAVFGIGAILFLYRILPFLITLAENTIYLGVLIGVIALMFIIATSSRVHNLIAVGFEAISRTITELFVELDPVDILNTYSKQMHQKADDVQGGITQLQGLKRNLDGMRSQSNQELQQSLKLADAAERSGDQTNLDLQTEIAGRRQHTLEDLDQKIATIADVLEAFKRVQKVVMYHIASSDDEKKTLIQQLAMQKTMDAANTAANKVLGGNSDLDTMRAMAADSIRNRYSNTMGELDALVENTKSMSGEVDLNQMVLRADGKARLDALRKQINKAETTTPALTAGSAPTFTASAGTPVAVNNRWADKLNHS